MDVMLFYINTYDISIQMGNKDSAPVLRDEDVAVLCESSGLTEEVFKIRKLSTNV